jgi:hypothetical protein
MVTQAEVSSDPKWPGLGWWQGFQSRVKRYEAHLGGKRDSLLLALDHQMNQLQTLTPVFTSCVAMGRLLTLSVSQFLHLYNGRNAAFDL